MRARRILKWRCSLTSGNTENAIVQRGRLDDGVKLLAKPYTLTTLAKRVCEALDTRED